MTAPLRLFIARVRAWLGSAAQDREFAQELQTHFEMLAEDYVRGGMSLDEARRQARLKLGMASSLASQHREVRGFRILDDLTQDLRFAWRLMLKERWFSAAAIAAIALGIGANTMGFTIINAAFFRGFAFEQADRLHAVSWRPDRGFRMRLSFTDYQEWREQAQSFSAMAAYQFGAINISDDHAPPEQTQGSWVTANHFDVLRQRPLLGRTFAAGEDQRGSEPVVIIGHQIWTNRFGRDPNIIGRILRINGNAATIIGVMPERMKFPEDSELWAPFVPTDAQLAREVRALSVFGRLKDGISKQQAAAEIDRIAQGARAAHPDATKDVIGGQVETLIERFLGRAVKPMFITVMGAVIFVLIIAIANVANLLLSRAMYRAREVAVRCSLGATRWRVIRQLLIESLALSAVGTLFGLAIAAYSVQVFDNAVQASGAPYWLRFTIDYRVLAYVAAIGVATGTLFGLAPALHVTRNNQHETLKDGTRGATGHRKAGRFGNGLVVAELALTVVLLCGAGLMVRSFVALYASDPGFQVEGLTRMQLQLPPSRYPTAESRARFFEALEPRLAEISGIKSIASTTSVPPLNDEQWRIVVDGRPIVDEERQPFIGTATVTPNYFDVLGVGITRGRGFVQTDGRPGSENVVINQVMADRHFPGEDPVGRRIRFVQREDEPEPVQSWRTIVGVSAPFLQGDSDAAFRTPMVYVPFQQDTPRTSSLLIRSSLPPATIMSAVRSAVQAVDADQPVFAIETVADVFANERVIYQIFSTLFGVLAAIGLTLSAVGVYGVMAYAVTQRTQEIGLRMAIGARRWDVSWMFLKRALIQVSLGLGIGLPAAMALASVARFRLVEIEPTDPVTLAGIAAILLAVALTSSLVPVRKASKVDPLTALRSE
ncbi:MAG TPA: ABC transporter permease [Vicinamibacterales bacterium]|nr:ABC transporter permease [Vicinamibacterales bacterium]